MPALSKLQVAAGAVSEASGPRVPTVAVDPDAVIRVGLAGITFGHVRPGWLPLLYLYRAVRGTRVLWRDDWGGAR